MVGSDVSDSVGRLLENLHALTPKMRAFFRKNLVQSFFFELLKLAPPFIFTLIIIAHRFSTIEHVEQIILLEKGKVTEIGTHQELVKKRGIFAKLRKLQQLRELG